MDAVIKREKEGPDYGRAQKVFEKYLDHYDREDGKVRLKIVHTYGVVAQSTALADRMGLSKEDRELARVIALLHDIGRFEQLKRFDSFLPDTMDHAAYGVQILFGDEDSGRAGMIREFVPEEKWDEIIRTAIARHSDFALDETEGRDKRTLLHARIIRDADKLDNCRVKLEDAFETFMDAPEDVIGTSEVSPKVREDALAGRSIRSADRVTPMDYWISYLAYFYDLNFRESLDIVEENDYVRKIIHRISYSNPETEETMKELEENLVGYVRGAKRKKRAGGMYIRPHHILCIQKFTGHGYNEEFTAHMSRAVSELAENPGTEITAAHGCDDLCEACPNNEDGVCTSCGKVERMDDAVLRVCDFAYGESASWAELSSRARKRIFETDEFQRICAGCQWFELCRKTEIHQK